MVTKVRWLQQFENVCFSTSSLVLDRIVSESVSEFAVLLGFPLDELLEAQKYCQPHHQVHSPPQKHSTNVIVSSVISILDHVEKP